MKIDNMNGVVDTSAPFADSTAPPLPGVVPPSLPSENASQLDTKLLSQSQKDINALISLDVDTRQHGGPVLLVRDDSLGKMVKMQSPHQLVVQYHSSRLGELFKSGLTRTQKQDQSRSLDDGLPLNGNYSVWQELCSHMGMTAPTATGQNQSAILDNLLTRLPLATMLDLFTISRYYDIKGHRNTNNDAKHRPDKSNTSSEGPDGLLGRYRHELEKRLNKVSYIVIFERALGRGIANTSTNSMRMKGVTSVGTISRTAMEEDSKDYSLSHPDLRLVSCCLVYFDRNMESLCDRTDQMHAQDCISLFHQVLGALFFA